ncbi:MAG: hypothetical protein KC478_17865, partial [Bacteriovoracaceae bacterium]|nr:hypothetical protein [Bacteriovoracaceae bacterium]
QDQAFGYIRAFGALVNELDGGVNSLEQYLPYDLYTDIRQSDFYDQSRVPREEFEENYKKRLSEYVCTLTNIQF